MNNTQLLFGRDVQGYNAFAPSLSMNMLSAELASGGDDEFDVPETADQWIAVFSYEPGAIIWVSVNDTAAPPAGNTFAAITSFLLPAQLSVKKGDSISCYNNSATDQDVGVALYAVS